MKIFANPKVPAIKKLLPESDLPTADVTAQHLTRFFGYGPGPELDGVVGLEL